MKTFAESVATRRTSNERDRNSGKQDQNAAKSTMKIPLTVLPKGAIYSFPYVLGLDTYEYEFGQNMAARAANRFQDKAKTFWDGGQGSGKAKLVRRQASSGTKMVQAGVTGSTAILCHPVHSSDSGGSKVRKRRQKLTDDLLHDLVVSYGDPVEVVHQWFQIFLHFCDPPEEIVLPSLPERREEISEPTLAPEKTNTSRTPSRFSSKSTKRSKALQRPCSAPSLKRPEIVRVTRRKCKNDDFEDDRNELQKTRSLLKEAGLAGPGAGQLDLAHRLKVQSLNEDAFSEWLESFNFIWNLQRLPTEALQQLQTSKPSSTQRRASRHRGKRDVTARYMTRLNEKVSGLGLWDFGEFTDTGFDGSATSSATVETEDEVEGPTTLNDLTLHQIMLRSSNLAMISCGVVRKKGQEEAGKHRSKAAFDEIARSRVEILNSVAPTQMTLKNFSAFVVLLGVYRRETIERVAKHLFLSVPRASHSNPSLEAEHEDDKDDHWQDSTTLPFEVFYQFVRALRASSLCSTDTSSANHPYIFSDLLCRLVFCALTGHEGVSHTAGAAAIFKADAKLKPLSSQSLFQSLKMFLSNEEGLRSESSEQEIQGLAEFVFAGLLRSQDSIEASGQSKISFNGFQNFVRQKPQVYLQLVFLLLPLATNGEEFAAEEMHLMQKGLYHRAGELREKAAALARQLQKRYLSDLFAEFVQPWKEVCRRASRSWNKDFAKEG